MLRRLTALCAASLLLAPACQSDVGGVAVPALRFNGALLGADGDLAFSATSVGGVTSLALEVVNLGDAPLRLVGDPPVRVVEDSALAFAATQPSLRELPPGAAAAFVVTFTPRAPGSATAVLVLATDAGETPDLSLALTGEGLPGGFPSLAVAVGGVTEPTVWDFGRAVVGAASSVGVRLTNDGAGTLTFGPASVAIVGPDADQYSVVGPDKLALGASEAATATLGFAPTRCGVFDARLSITTNAAGDPYLLPLAGDAIVSPLALEGVTDTTLIQVPDLVTVASADGSRVAVANPAADSFAGALSLAALDGCDLTVTGRMTAADVGYGGALFASAAALTASGDALLVTARDYATAWLFDLSGASDAAPFTLSTVDAGAGHGRAAALAADGSVAVIGQPLAASGGGAHGAAFVWARPDAGWATASEATLKLLPTDVAATTRLGQAVGVSHDGGVIVGGALVRRADQALAPAVLVWVAHDGTWGEERVPTNSHVRDPTATLLGSAPASSDATVTAAVTADGATIACAVAQSGGSVDLSLFDGDGTTWGSAGVDGVWRETAHLRLAGSVGWRFALAPDGSFLIGGDGAGVVELDRPEAGWDDAVAVSRSWDLAAFGDLVLIDGGALVGVLDPSGALQILWR
ncbi:MAG: hypothetical protein CVU56_17630 [Deltaproteobacteria bacterium HGW-Deltaproteobacteria-14]|jgi:hypothetical protein|nr:MAG: hypothetical protein CVU56_17630 [Deltaproteobacteria bacterium HGW-Deltaproteobacteria-14]